MCSRNVSSHRERLQSSYLPALAWGGDRAQDKMIRIFGDTESVSNLAPCEYRVELDSPGMFFCRHSAVCSSGNVVTTPICRSCSVRTMECRNPRRIPPTTEVPSPVEVSFARQVWNFATSAAAFISDGMTLVDQPTYAARLADCDTCESRSGNSCAQCGCSLTMKAAGRAFACPLGKWNNVPSRSSGEETS